MQSFWRIDPTAQQWLHDMGLEPSVESLEQLVFRTARGAPADSFVDLAECIGRLWRGVLDDRGTVPIELTCALARVLSRSAKRSTTQLSRGIVSAGLDEAKTAAYALFHLGIALYDHGRHLRPTNPPQAAMCFRRCVEALEEALDAEQLSEASRLHALGRIGVATAFLSRQESVPLVQLLAAHRGFEKSMELGNADSEAVIYLIELRTAMYRAGQGPEGLHGLLKNRRVRNVTDGRVDAAIMGIVVRLCLERLEHARNTGVLHGGVVDQLLRDFDEREAAARKSEFADEVMPAVVVWGALATLVREAVEGGDPGALRIPSRLCDPLYRPVQAFREIADGAGVNVERRLRSDICHDLRSASERCATHDLAAAELRFLTLSPSADQRDRARALAVSVVGREMNDEATGAVAIRTLSREWSRSRDRRVLESLVLGLCRFAATFPLAAWPLLRLADLAKQNQLGGLAVQQPLLSGSDLSETHFLRLAARRAAEDPSASRTRLGAGQSRDTVFVVDDPLSDVGDRIVFKEIDRQLAELEAARMRAIGDWARETGHATRFRAAEVVALLPDVHGGSEALLVLRREQAPSLFDLRSRDSSAILAHLEAAVDFLALIHAGMLSQDRPDRGAGAVYDDLRSHLKWPPVGFDATMASEARATVRGLYSDVPLIPKRDAHPGNWLIGDGTITAIDLCSKGMRPALYEVAQLIEDAQLLPVSDDGFAVRDSISRRYVLRLRDNLVRLGQDDLDPFTIDIQHAHRVGTYCRAVFLVNRSGHPSADRQYRLSALDHGTSLLAYLADGGGHARLRSLASDTLGAIRRLERRRVRLSRAMSWSLRHDATLVTDPLGWVGREALEERLPAQRRALPRVVDVVRAPTETRFHLSEDEEFVRAGYGHSVGVDMEGTVGAPPSILHHGTSESAVPSILRFGLMPMRRDYVHLVDDSDWATRIGSRHGAPAVVGVDTGEAQRRGVRFFNVSEGMWLASRVPPEALRGDGPATRSGG